MCRAGLLHCVIAGLVCTSAGPNPLAAQEKDPQGAAPIRVSYYKQVRPIFQANCHGCHQPAKAGGAFVMTSFDRLVAGGESGERAIVAGKPAESQLVEMIVPQDGKATMPRGRKPLAEAEIDLIRRWIAEGAADDTPAGAVQQFDMQHPPTYTRPPVITSIDFSPNPGDAGLLAVAGFHEVFLIQADSGERVARLVGVSERIESVRFSPDGKRLAVAGGLPSRMGEVQIWDVEKRKLQLSAPVTFDTVYGVSWSPNGKYVSFGCADNSVRAIDAETGEQVMFQGAHTDWVRDTVFSADSSHVVSVGRDMTTKLTELATQRFIDNVTSITPGALKGGILSVTRHPTRDEIVVGGSDSEVKVYRIHRLTKRVIGDDGNLIRKMPPMNGRIFGVAVSRDGKRIAAGSSLDATGEVHVYSYEFDTGLPDNIKAINEKVASTRSPAENETLEKYLTDGASRVAETHVNSAVYAVSFRSDGQVVAAAGADGVVRLLDASSGSIVREITPAPIAQPAVATNSGNGVPGARGGAVNFIRDVQPLLSRLGCNQGTCHGSAKGKNGFKLSLRGYDPLFDVRALTDDLASRRVNVASPDDSLMLLKPTAAVPHEGGQVLKPSDPYYAILRGWIADGARLDMQTPRVAQIAIFPQNPVIEKVGDAQRFRIMAIYEDGGTREVTREAFIESGNSEVAVAGRDARLTAARRGEAPVLARYEGQYAATTVTVMGDRSGFAWDQPPAWGRIDELVAAKWLRVKIQPSSLSNDAEFVRRIYLDLIGLPPTSADVEAFVRDTREARVKRDELVDKLIGSDDFVEFWTNKWADLLQVNRKFLGKEGAAALRKWIRDEIAGNTPYDQFVRKVLSATGSNRENPAAAYYKVLRSPQSIMENTTHLFLGVRFNCNKCHDHPFERWTQDQYYQTAAFFAQVDLKKDPAGGNANIGGTAVENPKPLYEIVFDKTDGEILHDRTGQVTPPKFPFDLAHAKVEESSATAVSGGCAAPGDTEPMSRRDQFAHWLTSADNPYFARSYVNRLWGYLLGVGIMEPIDDIRAGNPPTNPELLDYLTQEFVRSGFDVRQLMRAVCKSRTYQLAVESNRWNADDKINYSHARARRLPAEVLADAVYRVTGSQSKFPEVAPGTRAASLPDSGIELPGGFLNVLGRPARESACECERSTGLQLGPVMSLISGPAIADAIADPNNELTRLIASESDDRKVVNEVFLRILNRSATEQEIVATIAAIDRIDVDHKKLETAYQERQEYVRPIRERQEAEREAAIAKAKQDLETTQKDLEPARLEQERQRSEKATALGGELKEFEKNLAAKLPELEKQQTPGKAQWIPLDPKSLKASRDAKLTKQDDLSVIAEVGQGPITYTFTAETPLTGITAVRLEALTDDRLPSRGPGLAENGNFVVTEFDLKIAPKGMPRKVQAVKLENAMADFSQEAYAIKTAVDGQRVPQNNGWAVHPNTSVTHWATFEIKEPVGFEGGTILTFTLDQQFADQKHSLGKFRISISTAALPVGLGLPGDLDKILAIPAEARDDAQRAAVVEFFASREAEYRKQQMAFADAKRPVPTDPKIVQLQNRLAEVSRPVPEDLKLVQLRQDYEMSKKQLENKRLTGVQDLAWALINSPAFLFNH
jgi:WD40 repeat protein